MPKGLNPNLSCACVNALMAFALTGCSSITLPNTIGTGAGLILLGLILLAVPTTLTFLAYAIAPTPRRDIWAAAALLTLVLGTVIGTFIGLSRLNGGSTMPLVMGFAAVLLVVFFAVLILDRLRFSVQQRRLPLEQRQTNNGMISGRAGFYALVVFSVLAAAGLGSYFYGSMQQRYETLRSEREINAWRERVAAQKVAETKVQALPPPTAAKDLAAHRERVASNDTLLLPVTQEDVASLSPLGQASAASRQTKLDACKIDVLGSETVAQARAGQGTVLFTAHSGSQGLGGLVKLRHGAAAWPTSWGEVVDARMERSDVFGNVDDDVPYLVGIHIPNFGVVSMEIVQRLQCTPNQTMCTTLAYLNHDQQRAVGLRETCPQPDRSPRLFPRLMYQN
jgi:hypothetical protein